MTKIAVFNHKGGVAKTTTTFNLGSAIARQGKKVLLVDTDSQCNLTLYSMGYEKYENYCELGNQNNIYGCLIPAYKSQPRLVEAAECYLVENNLYLLPGNLDFTENEVQLGIAMQLSNALGSMGNLPGALNYLIEKTCEKYQIDYVLFDMNPSLSAINQDIVISSDYFVVPTSPDFFSIMAIRSLARVLPSWERWAKEARNAFSGASYTLPLNTPKFLGYSVNDFNLSKGAPQKSFRSFINRISNEVTDTLIPALEASGMLLSNEKYDCACKNMERKFKNENVKYENIYCLAQISNFNKLIAISNEQSIPVFDITLNKATDGQKKTLNWFKMLYKAMAERIIELTNE